MAKTLNLRIAGLFTSQNDFGQKPGMLDVADNIVIDQQDLAQSRKGFDALEFDFPDADDRANRFARYQDVRISHFGENSLAYYDESTGWEVFAGTYDHPDELLARCRFLQANLNFYITTSLGIKKLDAYDGTPVSAGVPRALDLAVSLSGSSGFLTPNIVKAISVKTTNASSILTEISDDDIVDLLVGQYVTGTNIPANSQVQDISLSETVLVTEGELTAASTTLTNVVSTAGVVAGQIVEGNGLLPNTRVVSVSGAGPYDVDIDQAAIQSGTPIVLTFRSDNTVTLSNAATGTGTVTATFSDGSQIGYRLLWGYRDANNNLLRGAPSAMATVTNATGGTRDISAVASIPAGITTSHFYQLYRTAATLGSTISPIDQEQLVAEGFPSSGDITAGFVTILDQTPDSLKGEALYTGSDQEGISQSNYEPPLAKDFCLFKGFVLFANTSLKQQLELTIDGVGSPSGVQVGDVITIAGVAFTAASAEDIAAGEFEVFSAGTPAQNIADTANSFIRVVNRYASNTAVYAYLLSGSGDLPGQMLIEARSAGASSFAVTASAHGSAWTPNLPTSGTSVSSSAETETNAIYVSKFEQPEAVPLVNKFPVGSRSNSILRVVPLRDYVVVFATDGIYRFSGDDLNSFNVQPFDLTTRLVAPESAVPLGNEAWCLSNQGVVSISDAGVQSRSALQIDDKIRELLSLAPDATAAYAFAVGYETDHRYILSVPDSNEDTFCVQQYCFNYYTEAWTRWTRACTAGFVDPIQDLLYLGNGQNEKVVFERKSGTFADYVDEPFPVTIVSSDEDQVVLADASEVVAGDILSQGDDRAEILEVDTDANTVVVNRTVEWTPSDAEILPAIACSIQWKPSAAGDPTEAKQYAEGQIIFREATFTTSILAFLTDIVPSFGEVTVPGGGAGLWGLFPWGLAPWGGVARSRTIRFWIPLDKQYCGSITVKFSVRSGLTSWLLEGISLVVFDESFELGK